MTASYLSSFAQDGKVFAYLSRENEIFFEKNSFLGRIIRPILTFLGFRCYDIPKILQTMQSGTNQDADVEFLTQKLVKKAGLSESDFENLKILSLFYRMHDQTGQMPILGQSDIEALQLFIENSIANHDLNQSLSTLMNHSDIIPSIHKKALQTLHTFSHKTKDHEKLEGAVEKIKKIIPLLTSQGINGELKDEEKLSHRNLIVMEEIVKLAPIVREFQRFGLYAPKDSTLGALERQIIFTENFINRVHNIAEKQVPHSKSGMLILYDTENFAAKRSLKTRIFDKIVFKYLFRTPIFHASIGYSDKKGRDIEVDVWAKFRKSRRSLYSRTFKALKFNIEMLASTPETKKQLIELYGEKWIQKLEGKFKRILRSYYKNPNDFKHLYNPASRRLLAGLGLRWSPLAYDLRERTEFENNQTVCSEFATKTLIHCFMELQEKVNQDWNQDEARKTESTPKLSHPIRPKRRLNRVTPDDMARRLINTGYAEETEIAPIIKDLILLKEYEFSK